MVGGAVVGGAVVAAVVGGVVARVVLVGAVVVGSVPVDGGSVAVDGGSVCGGWVVGAASAVVGAWVVVGAVVGAVVVGDVVASDVVGSVLVAWLPLGCPTAPPVAADSPASAEPRNVESALVAEPSPAWSDSSIVSVALSATATVKTAKPIAPAETAACLARFAGWLRLGMVPSNQVGAGPHQRNHQP